MQADKLQQNLLCQCCKKHARKASLFGIFYHTVFENEQSRGRMKLKETDEKTISPMLCVCSALT